MTGTEFFLIERKHDISDPRSAVKLPERQTFIRKALILPVVMIIFLALTFASGCSEKKPQETYKYVPKRYVSVGFSQLGAESDWRVANTESVKRALSRNNGFNLNFSDAQQKQDKQIVAIRGFIQQRVDMIVMAPLMETGWEGVLNEARDAGIPVVVMDRMVKTGDDSLFTAWVGSDFYREGALACAWLNKYISLNEVSQNSVRIVDIQGTLGATSQIGRTDSLRDSCEHYGWKLLVSVPADYTRAKGKEVMESILHLYRDVNVVYCENDNEALGVIDAIEEAGKKAGTDISNGEILIISFDAAHSGLEKMLEGKIALDVECNPLQGEAVREVIEKIRAGLPYQKYMSVPETVFAVDDSVPSVYLGGERVEIVPLTREILDGREY